MLFKQKIKISISIILLGVLCIGAYFFWKNKLNTTNDVLNITMSIPATDLSPYALNLNNITRSANIYQGLVGLDRNLRTIPALAVSWGNTDETTWEFKLRENVTFHDGSPFTGEDVVQAFQKAKESKNSQIEPHINSIREIEFENGKIVVKTFAPDPLLLSKLSKLFIYTEEGIGTGPYELKKWIPGEKLSLRAYKNYWGESPNFKEVDYLVESNKNERERKFSLEEIDILGAVTEDQTGKINESNLKTVYGLEVNFLMFKLDHEVFSDKSIRETLAKLIDPEAIVSIGNGFIRPSNQFIAPGVFGYNQEIKPLEYNKNDEPRDLFGARLLEVNLDYISSYRTLSEYLAGQFKKAGINLNTNPLEPGPLLEKIEKNESELYLVGWRAENGDAGSFFDTFIHSNGSLNKERYKNDELNALIKEARNEMQPQKRLALLKEIGLKLNEEAIGIPLFEPSRSYAVQSKIDWEPRLDGMVLANEVHKTD